MVDEVVYTLLRKLRILRIKLFADAKASDVSMSLEPPKDQTFYLPCFGLKSKK